MEQSPGASSPVHLPCPLLQGCTLQRWSLGMHGGRLFTCSTYSVLGTGSLGARWPQQQPAQAVSLHRFELLSVASPDFRWSRRLSPMRVLITFLLFIKGPLSALQD